MPTPRPTPSWPSPVPTPALCSPRNDRLWICMEFCGGGSLQEIYHGEGPAARPQRTRVFFPPLPFTPNFPLPPHSNIARQGRPGSLDLGSSRPLTGCVTLREMLSFSGLCTPDCAGRGCGQHPCHLAVPAASPTQGGLGGSAYPPDLHASPYPFHFSHRAPGGTADCLCVPRGIEGS